MRTSLFGAIGFALIVGVTPVAAQTIQHPLDPLSFQECWAVLEVLQEAGRVNGETRFSIINLRQPDKNMVWSWSRGQEFPRLAFAVVRLGADAYEAVVDVKQRRLTSWNRLEGVQPNWLDEEFRAMEKEVKAHPDFMAAMKKRGITDFTFLRCSALPPGYFGTDEQRGRRIGHVQCSDTRRVRNTFPRQITGLTAVVDLNAKQVLRVVDEGVVPVTGAVADYDPASIGPVRDVPSPMPVDLHPPRIELTSSRASTSVRPLPRPRTEGSANALPSGRRRHRAACRSLTAAGSARSPRLGTAGGRYGIELRSG